MAVAGDDDVNGNDSNSLESTGQSFPQPRLTGRRKRRHLSDPEFLSWTHSPESTSPSSGHALQHRSFAFEDRRKNVALAHDKITYTNSSRNYGDFSTFIAPQKLHNEDLFASYVAANADIASKGLRGLSGDPDSESIYNLRLHVAARSAPTSAFPSHVSSPHRTSNVDVFHPSFMAPQELHGKLVAHSLEALPATTLRGPDLLPHNLNLFSREWTENKHVDAHPLLPFTGASLSVLTSKQRQSTMLPYAAENKFVPSTKFQWQKGKLIGRGTFGSVFHATNLGTGASCAMKEVDIIPDDPKSSEHIKQLEQEINILSQLHHPNIVQYYGSEIVGNHFYIYMEYVHPGSINKFVREHCGAITESVVRNFTHHILSGLAYLHGTKTIHRDIKGANLLVDASGTVKLADFGMAKILTGQSYDLSLKGSPYWMAPEVMKAVIKKNTNLDLALAVDIWSLGCTIIEMLTGKPPWSEFEGVQAMFKVLHKTPPIPETLSSEGKDFLQQCFQRNPADRPSAAKLLEHAFVQNMHEQDQDVFAPPKPYPKPISPVVMDESGGPRDRAKRNSDVMPVSMSTRIINKVQKFIGHSCQRYLKHFTG